jgi:predicted metal-dependent phosphoesterase TrpH
MRQQSIENRILILMSTVNWPLPAKNTPQVRFDLHCHSQASDGSLTPEQLVERAVNFQIQLLALTDHDTLDGIAPAQAYITERNYPLSLMPGIEFSTAWHGFDIHIVGLNIDVNNSELVELVKCQQQARQQRAIAMGEKLAKAGVEGVYDKAQSLAANNIITRSHYAQALLDLGHVKDLQQAFDKYIGKGKRAFVKPKWCDIAKAVTTILAAGGVPVLAHPIRYDLSGKWRRRLIEEFKEAGGLALEIILPQMNAQQRELMLNYCLEYDLFASAGSDFHHPGRWSELGKNLNLPAGCRPVWQLWATAE